MNDAHGFGPAEPSGAAVYRSKTDWWLGAVLWVAILALVASAGSLWLAAGPPALRLGTAACFLAVAAFVLWILRGTRYQALAARAPHLEVRGERLERAGS